MSLASRLLPIFIAGMFVHASAPSYGEALMAAVAADSTSNAGIEMQGLEGPDMAGSIPRTGLVDGDWRDMVETLNERRKWLKLAQSDFDGSSMPVDDRPLSATDIREVQRLLLELGYAPGPIDGKSGPSTAAAISAYQKTEGLPVNGRPSQGLLLNLREVANGRKATPALKPDEDVPPEKKEDAAPAGTARVQESGGQLLVGSEWLFKDGSGSEFTLRLEKGGAVGGVLYEKFWSWRHRGNDIEILYDNDLGSRVTRVGAMKTKDLMEGTAVSSRGGGWTWKADRIHPPIEETEEAGAAPSRAGQPPADSTTSNDSGMSDDAAPSSPDNAPEASSAPHEQESMPTDDEKQPVPTDSQPQKLDAVPPAASSSRSGETSASEQELSGAGPPSATGPSPLTADSRPGGAGQLTETEKPQDRGVEKASREPRTYGIENDDSRIIIRAIDDCWIEVTDANGKTLFSRVLRDGESYRAPAIKGAKMITGNAGGLEILVDGVPIEFSGTEGVVRRDIRLDPDLLKSGDAW